MKGNSRPFYSTLHAVHNKLIRQQFPYGVSFFVNNQYKFIVLKIISPILPISTLILNKTATLRDAIKV